MITWTVRLTAREEKIEEWIALANELTETSHAMDEGCVVYLCLQHYNDPREFTWYEQWADERTLREHIARLGPLLGGSPRAGETNAPRLADVLERREQVTWHEIQDADPLPRDWRSPEVTGLLYITVQPGAEDAMRGFAPELVRESQVHEGCTTYLLAQNDAEPRLFMLFEQWRDEAAVEEHLERLRERFGGPGEAFPRLPTRLSDLMERMEYVAATVVA